MPKESPIISLRPITPQNFREVIRLQVSEDQKNFVASNAYSLAEAGVFPHRSPLAIYADETPVGFLMSAFDEETQRHWIFRLMIAASQQGHGYGRAAMRLLIERMRAIPGCT
ncbi:MAG: GNAT family N-acetyltransferase, partial [Anaerolineaceae bacterium]|nr:GNAT family N-acetyltransferase [Anaerolineaceae bacterium]